MIDSKQKKQDIVDIRKLAHERFQGKITHEQLEEELTKIAGRQPVLFKREK